VDQQRQVGESHQDGAVVAWVSDVGCIRTFNEDRCAVEEGLFILSDGMGGESAGAAASEFVCGRLPDLLAEHLKGHDELHGDEIEQALRDATMDLSRRMRDESGLLAGPQKMGATLLVAVLWDDRIHLAHVGDSRAYLFDGASLRRVTEDHSVVGVLVHRGALTTEQAEQHPMRGHLSRYIGMKGNALADVVTLDWQRGDRLLLCTDGLTEYVDDESIQRVVSREVDLAAACHMLADAAREGGGRDNITVLIVEKSR
jgi:serine/threonine protein phosphatase PrpC